MEFKEAMRTWGRICKTDTCESCPMPCAKPSECMTWVMTHTRLADEILEKWAAEHPAKTIADDFFEKHPKAKYIDGMVPGVCAFYCGYDKPEYCQKDAAVCAKCWREPLKEATP